MTLVTGNPTNVLLAEDLGDTFVSFAGRMGIPVRAPSPSILAYPTLLTVVSPLAPAPNVRHRVQGIAAGLTSFVLMYWTNRNKVDVVSPPQHGMIEEDRELGQLSSGEWMRWDLCIRLLFMLTNARHTHPSLPQPCLPSLSPGAEERLKLFPHSAPTYPGAPSSLRGWDGMGRGGVGRGWIGSDPMGWVGWIRLC